MLLVHGESAHGGIVIDEVASRIVTAKRLSSASLRIIGVGEHRT